MGMYCTTPKQVKARKPHKCCVCPDPIEAGTVYSKWFVSDDGNGGTCKMHLGCEALMDLYRDPWDYTFDEDPNTLGWSLEGVPWAEVEQLATGCDAAELVRLRRLWDDNNATPAPADAGRKEGE